jgi:hypothetical protein
MLLLGVFSVVLLLLIEVAGRFLRFGRGLLHVSIRLGVGHRVR